MGEIVLGNHEAAGGVLVEPVDDARPPFAADAGERRAMGQERVDERTRLVARRGVRDQPGGLVDHQQIVVLVKQRQVNRLGDECGVHRRRFLPRNHVGRTDRLAGLGRTLVQLDVTLADEGLHAGT